MIEKILDQGLKELGIDLELDYDRFLEFQELLLEWNEKMDLTNITEDEDVYVKHYLDSLSLFQMEEFRGEKKLLDIGTGAGFPGIPLKLVNDKLDIVLMDSLKKRLVFLDHVIEEMDLKDIHTIHTRAEEAANNKKYRENFDIVTSRAVARLNILTELALPYVKVGGIFAVMKGPGGLEELEEAQSAIEKLGGKVRLTKEFDLWENDNRRTLILVDKIKSTPSKYPRNFGQIKKKPL